MFGAIWRGLVTRPWLALVAALAVELAVFVAGQDDIAVADPLWYAASAYWVSTHPLALFAAHNNHPFAMRIGLTGPLALLYRAFGVSTIVTNLPCLIAALAVVAIVYAAAPTPRAKLIGALLCAACVPLAQNANMLNVDLPCAAVMAASILCLSRRDRPAGRWWLAAAAATWFAAFLVKESALWCGAVWAYAVIVDVRAIGARRVARLHAPAIGVGIALAAGYLALCAELSGDALARFTGIDALTYDHAWAFDGQPATAWVNRLTWQPAWMLAKMFGATLVPVAFAPWLVRGADRIWWFATAAFTLLYWFGSSSMAAYAPLPISPRMVLPVLPGLLVIAAIASDRGLDRIRHPRWRTAIGVALAAVIVASAVRAIRPMVARGRPETAAFEAVRAEVADPAHRVVVVCGEPRCASAANFYFQFAEPANLTVTTAGDFAGAPRPEGASVRALVNHLRSPGARRTDPHLDMTGPIDALGLAPIAGDRNVRLYDAGDGLQLWNALRAAR